MAEGEVIEYVLGQMQLNPVFSAYLFFFQAEDGIRDLTVTGVRRVLFRSEVGLAVGAVAVGHAVQLGFDRHLGVLRDRKSTRLNSSHSQISYAVFCLKKKKKRK